MKTGTWIWGGATRSRSSAARRASPRCRRRRRCCGPSERSVVPSPTSRRHIHRNRCDQPMAGPLRPRLHKEIITFLNGARCSRRGPSVMRRDHVRREHLAPPRERQRHPSMTTNATTPPAAPATEEKFALPSSRHYPDWLARAGASLAFTTYQAGKLFLVGLKAGGRLAVFERTFARCMGLGVRPDARTLVLATQYQLLRFDNVVPRGGAHGEHDAVFSPTSPGSPATSMPTT